MTVPFKTWATDNTFKQKDLSARVIGLFQEGKDKGILNPDIPAQIMFDVLYGIMHRSVYIWLYLNQKDSLTANANLYYDMIWRAIADPNRQK